MSRYLDVADGAKRLVKDLVSMVPEVTQPAAAELITRIVNLAIRACPRGVQHTVRFNIVRAMVRGVEDMVRVSMEARKDEKTGRTYHVLTTQRVSNDRASGVVTLAEEVGGDTNDPSED